MAEAADRLDEDTAAEDLPKLVLDLALRGYAYSLACHRTLAVLAQHSGHEDILRKKK